MTIEIVPTSGATVTIARPAVLRLQRTIAFAVVGVLVVMRALPGLFYHGFEYVYLLRQTPLARDQFVSQSWAQIASSVAMAALGVTLFFGAKGLTRLWQGFRSPGAPGVENDLDPAT